MKQIWIPRSGPPGVLELREAADPEPGAGALRIRVEASGVNFADLMARMGTYPDGPPPPCVVGYEVAGVVDRLGAGVSEDWLGAEVVTVTRFGGYASHVVVDADAVARKPAGLDFAAAASLPVVGLTAWMMLEEMHRLRPGDRVLVHSAGGALGLVACDLLKRRGATAVGTASGHKHDFLRAWGYDELVDYRTQDYEAVLSEGPLFDLVLDPLGGHHWGKGLRLLKTAGKLVCFGMSVNAQGDRASWSSAVRNVLRIPWWRMGPVGLINANRGVLGVNMGRMWDEQARLKGWLEQLFALVESGALRTHVHARIPFSSAAEAHRILHARENLGKVVLIPD